jgi:hypothetical protein
MYDAWHYACHTCSLVWKGMLLFVLAGLHPDSTLEMTTPLPTSQSTLALDGQVASSHTRHALHAFKLVFAGPTDNPVAYPNFEMLPCACR